jgi:hypothetical protein
MNAIGKFKSLGSKSPIFIALFFTAIVMIFATININMGSKRWPGLLKNDARGYYSYLPAVFIYGDLNYGFFESSEEKNPNPYEYRVISNNQYTNKYFAGTAVALMPFFCIAHTFSVLTGQETSGYEKPYMFSVAMAAVFYCLAGLYLLSLTLGLLQFSRKVTISVLSAFAFGSHLFYYTIAEPGMSHVYSFFFVALFVYAGCLVFQKNQTSATKWLAFALGMLILIRPVNAMVVLLIPFFSNGISDFVNHPLWNKKQLPRILSSFALFTAIISVQPIIYKVSTGEFFTDSYKGESFNFTEPAFFSILFSFKKGLFIYTPMFLLSVLGFIYWFRQSTYRAGWMLAALIVIIYVLSSWWNWWYGGSFSSRVFVEFIPLFAILLAGWIQETNKKVVYVFITLLVVICQIQTYQYRHGQIHWEDMTAERYLQCWSRLLR